MRFSIRIEAPSARSALGLAQAVRELGPTVARASEERWEVKIEDGSEATLDCVTHAIESWLDTWGIDATKLQFDGREFRISRPAGIGRSRAT